jgi:hypothetical protein
MLTLLAMDPRDGWAFVQDDVKTLLLRPPYRQSDTRVVPNGAASRAVTQGDFRAEDKKFDGWATLIAFVRDEVVRQSRADGRVLGHPELGEEVLRHAPPSLVSALLDRIESSLLPEGQLARAEEMIDAVLHHASCLREDEPLWERTKEMHAGVKRRQKQHQAALESLSRSDDSFPRLKAKNSLEAIRMHGHRIKRRGSLFGG